MLRTRPSCLQTTDTTVVYTPQIHYRHDRRVSYTTVVYVTDTTSARWRHTPTKLLPLTSRNPNPNPNPNPTSLDFSDISNDGLLHADVEETGN